MNSALNPQDIQARDVELDDILGRVGRLNYAWTNTESLLIHLIAGLAKVEKDIAVVIFLTLNTTRARVDMVDRLAKMAHVKSQMRDDILALTSRLTREAALRNKYNHCIYSFDPEGGQIQTIMMRIQDRRKDIRVGKTETVTSEKAENINACIMRLEKLNIEIWELARKYAFPL
ncbi:hypothetical protein Q4544_14010 [Cognatishimia sp. 1_MG-2023]|uniref:hypothetical protein n=1 Tax=Cognatishimia sp. 1_MG-2023 TaxID=3062642 RepID=UPI0026E2B69A|nr:hypothetical protein [Cognatishimia sp. 1_MG-2023]MDO6728050.1 hypothetical protein [Cognatishimia sp. 1_MG-2023]